MMETELESLTRPDDLRAASFKFKRNNPTSVSHQSAAMYIELSADRIEQLRQRVAELESLLQEAYADADQVLRPRVAELEKEVAQWKNHHETEVRRARILKERTDMPIERVQAYEQWGKDQARIAELEKELSDCGNLGLRSCAEIDNLTTERNELLEANKVMADDLIDRHDRIADLVAERDAALAESARLRQYIHDDNEQITTLKSALREAMKEMLRCQYYEGQLDKAIATINAALGEEK